MLTKRDLSQIGGLIRDSEGRLEKKIEEGTGKVILAVGEMLEQNVLPQIEEVREDVAFLKKDITSIKATMVTKDYLDEKLGGLKGDMTAKHKEFDRRLTALEPRTKTPLA